MLGEVEKRNKIKKKHSNFTRESFLKGEQWLSALPFKTHEATDYKAATNVTRATTILGRKRSIEK